jgi:hypothetical protein
MIGAILTAIGAWAFSSSGLPGSALGGLIGNRTDRLICAQTEAILNSLREGNREPRNGDLTRAIRRSQLLAMRLGIKAYRGLSTTGAANSSPVVIADRLDMWIDAALASDTLAMNASAMTGVEAQIERAFLHPEPHEGDAAARLAAFRAIAEDWTLAEARAEVPGAADWDRFALFIRAGGATKRGRYPGWWPLFRAFLARDVKQDAVVQRILAEQGIAKLLDQQEGLAAILADMQAGQETLVAALDSALVELRAAAQDAGRLTAALAHLDQDFETILPMLVRIEADVARLPSQLQQSIAAANRAWHGITHNLGQAILPDEQARLRPTALLIARFHVVPFLDRGGLLAGLLDWARTTTRTRTRGRLYTAPGGYGKTRLGMALLEALYREGWRCTFLSQRNAAGLAAGALANFFQAERAAGICIIIDYAEGQEKLLRDLASAAPLAGDGPPIRLLAFARSAEGWWNDFLSNPGALEIFDPQPFAALATSPSAAECAAFYAESRRALAAKFRDLGLDC